MFFCVIFVIIVVVVLLIYFLIIRKKDFKENCDTYTLEAQRRHKKNAKLIICEYLWYSTIYLVGTLFLFIVHHHVHRAVVPWNLERHGFRNRVKARPRLAIHGDGAHDVVERDAENERYVDPLRSSMSN